MKLIIQIPAFNEARHAAAGAARATALDRGVDGIEILVIDDGSSDRTAQEVLSPSYSSMVPRQRLQLWRRSKPRLMPHQAWVPTSS